jgi:tetratricopeptide (TPR) repeat protein
MKTKLALSLALAGLLAAAEAPLQRGIDLFEQEDYKAAQSAFEDALAADPDNPDHLLWLGRALGRRAERSTGFKALGAFSLARQCRERFEQAVAIDPYHTGSLQALFDYYINAPGIVGGGDDKAEALLPQMEAADIGAALRARAALHEKREQYDQAEALLRKAIALRPDEVGHRLSLASFLSRRARFDESDRSFAEVKAQQDAPPLWFSRAKALIRSNRNPDEARGLLQRYLKTPLHTPDADPYSDARKLLDEL